MDVSLKKCNNLNGKASSAFSVLLNGKRDARSMQTLCDHNHNYSHPQHASTKIESKANSCGAAPRQLLDSSCSVITAKSRATFELSRMWNGARRNASADQLAIEPSIKLVKNRTLVKDETVHLNGYTHCELPDGDGKDEPTDKIITKEQHIVEVLRQLVRDCTNPDPSKRPSAFEVNERLQPLVKQ